MTGRKSETCRVYEAEIPFFQLQDGEVGNRTLTQSSSIGSDDGSGWSDRGTAYQLLERHSQVKELGEGRHHLRAGNHDACFVHGGGNRVGEEVQADGCSSGWKSEIRGTMP